MARASFTTRRLAAEGDGRLSDARKLLRFCVQNKVPSLREQMLDDRNFYARGNCWSVDTRRLLPFTHVAMRPSENTARRIGEKRIPGDQKGPLRREINEGTFKSTFYKLAGAGKTKSVRRPKPGRFVAGHDGPEAIMRAGLHFIHLAGGVEAARERLVGLEQLIDVAKAAD